MAVMGNGLMRVSRVHVFVVGRVRIDIGARTPPISGCCCWGWDKF